MHDFCKRGIASMLLISFLLESCYSPNMGIGKKSLNSQPSFERSITIHQEDEQFKPLHDPQQAQGEENRLLANRASLVIPTPAHGQAAMEKEIQHQEGSRVPAFRAQSDKNMSVVPGLTESRPRNSQIASSQKSVSLQQQKLLAESQRLAQAKRATNISSTLRKPAHTSQSLVPITSTRPLGTDEPNHKVQPGNKQLLTREGHQVKFQQLPSGQWQVGKEASHANQFTTTVDNHKQNDISPLKVVESSFSGFVMGLLDTTKGVITNKINTFAQWLGDEIVEVSPLVNAPTIFQAAQDKKFWRADYSSDMESLKRVSSPSLQDQDLLVENQDLVWSGLLSPYHYEAGLGELEGIWPSALLKPIKDEWRGRLNQHPDLLAKFLLEDLRACFQENLKSSWNIESFKAILTFYRHTLNALDYKDILVYVRDAVIKNKKSNVLTIGQHKELISALNEAIDKSNKVERRVLKAKKRRFIAEAQTLPFFFEEAEISSQGIWHDVKKVNEEGRFSSHKGVKKGKLSKDEISSEYVFTPVSLLKGLGKGLMRGIDFTLKHPGQAITLGLATQVAAVAAIKAFSVPKRLQESESQENTTPDENKSFSQFSTNEAPTKPASYLRHAKRALGDEFQINQNTIGNSGIGFQDYPSAISLNNGNVLVAWDSQTGNDDIYGRIFSANGTALSDEFMINQNTTGIQSYHATTSLNNGNIFAAWDGYQRGNSYPDIYGRIFSANGTALGNEFIINPSAILDLVSPFFNIANLDNDNIFVSWTNTNASSLYSDAYGRIFSANGIALTGEFILNQDTTNDQLFPSVAGLNNGNAFVIWRSNQNGNNDAFGRVFSHNGTALSNEFIINQITTGTQAPSYVMGLDNGNAFVSWVGFQTGSADIYGRIFFPNGTPFSNEFRINQVTTGTQNSHSIVSLNSGNIFTAWAGNQNGNDDIYGRVFFPNGADLSNEFSINQMTLGNQRYPIVTSLNNGNVLAIWESDQTGNNDIYGRVFSPNGAALSNEFSINQMALGNQRYPSAIDLSNDNIFVAWTGDQTGNDDIYGRILTSPFLEAQGNFTTTSMPTTNQGTTNMLTSSQGTMSISTTQEFTTNQGTTSRFTTNGLMTEFPPTTSLLQSQSSQEGGSSKVEIWIGMGVGGAVVLGGSVGLGYYLYKRAKNKRSSRLLEANSSMELEKRVSSPFSATSTGFTNHPTVIGALQNQTYEIWKELSTDEGMLVQPRVAKKISLAPGQFILGKGKFGATYVGSKTGTKELYAIKEVYGSKAVTESQQEGELQNELKDCPQIMSLVDYRAFEPKSLNDQPRLFQIMPLAYTNGAGYKQMLSLASEKALHENLVSDSFQQVMKGLAYMHEKGIYHLDMKDENILYMQDGTLKIADFGRARKLGKNDTITDDRLGDRRFFSPEQFAFIRHTLKQQGEDIGQGETIDSFPAWAADTWGGGLYILKLLSPQNNPLSDGVSPYQTKVTSWTNENFQNALSSIPNLQEGTTKSFKGVLRGILAANFKDRLKPTQAVKEMSSLKILSSGERAQSFRHLVLLQENHQKEQAHLTEITFENLYFSKPKETDKNYNYKREDVYS